MGPFAVSMQPLPVSLLYCTKYCRSRRCHVEPFAVSMQPLPVSPLSCTKYCRSQRCNVGLSIFPCNLYLFHHCIAPNTAEVDMAIRDPLTSPRNLFLFHYCIAQNIAEVGVATRSILMSESNQSLSRNILGSKSSLDRPCCVRFFDVFM